MTDSQRSIDRVSHASSPARAGFDLVQADPRRAVALLDAVVGDHHGAPTERAIALWGLGRLAIDENRIGEALTSLSESAAILADTPHRDLLAEVRITWAAAAQVAGRSEEATEQLRLAEPDLSGAPLGRLLTQRGMLLMRAGDRDAALRAMDAALPLVLQGGDELGATRLISNRGIVLLQLGRLTEARVDFGRAKEMAARLGQHVLAAGSAHNEAYLDARLGRVPQALRGFADARARYASVGSPARYVGDLDIDEATVLIEAGLGQEAAAVTARVVEAARTDGNHHQVAEALLTLARAELLCGNREAARAASEDAETLFTEARRPAWAAVAAYWGEIAGRGPSTTRPPGLRRVATLRRLAERLDRYGWSQEAAEVRVLMARQAHQSGRADLAGAVLDEAQHAHHSPNARVRADAWLVSAIGHVARGEHTKARRALAQGLRTVERYRATLGAAELRSAAGRLGAELAEFGVHLAVQSGDARQLLTWAERWRAGSLGLPRSDDATTVPADLLDELRQTRLRADDACGTPDETIQRRRVADLELSISRLSRARGSSGRGRRSQPMTDLLRTLGDSALVEFVHTGGHLHAVVCRDRRVRQVDLGPIEQARAAADHLGFATRRLAAAGDRSSARRFLEAFDLARRELDGVLFGPVGDDITGRALVVVPSADLHHVLWNALPTADRGAGLTTAPSAVWWAAETAPRRHRRTLLVAGPGLVHADAEVTALAAQAHGASILRGADASVSAVLAGMDRADVVHLAAHGVFRADNPWFSTLQLADGALHVHELEAVRHPPHTVVIAACSGGRSTVLAGDELLGATAALLAVGVRTVVAPLMPIDDEASVPVAVAVHRAIRGGGHAGATLAALVTQAVGDGHGALAAAASSFTYVSRR